MNRATGLGVVYTFRRAPASKFPAEDMDRCAAMINYVMSHMCVGIMKVGWTACLRSDCSEREL